MNKQIHEFSEDLFRLGIKAIILNPQGKILLLKVEKRDPNSNSVQQIYWDFPGGQIDYGESITEALKREVVEEIGISKINIHQFLAATVTKIRNKSYSRDVGLIIFAYYCTINNNLPIQISEEHTTFSWENPSKLKKLIGNKYDDIFIKQIKEFIQNVN